MVLGDTDGMWDDLVPLLLGAAATLGVTTFVQLRIVPRVESRKRREDRWSATSWRSASFWSSISRRRKAR
jgi:hypothetical protein